MKNIFTSVNCLLAIIFHFSCTDKFTEEISLNAPLYMSYEELRSSVKNTAPRDLVNPGKIYFKGSYLLIVEYFEGIHFIDVSNPASPQNKAFIEVPGCVDIAVKENSLYADSYTDLVVIDVSDMNSIKETGRIKDVLPYKLPEIDNGLLAAKIEQEKGIVIGWETTREKREIETGHFEYYTNKDGYISDLVNPGNSIGGGSAGKSGSMARFGLYNSYLYVANDYTLHIFDIRNPSSPIKDGNKDVNGFVETMFIHDNHIFFGTPNGMTVYSLKVPTVPEYIGSFWHVTTCDPVVIQDEYAYITLRGGNGCGSNVNRLDVVKMSDDYKEYELVGSWGMVGPYGLGIDKNTLFVCDGEAGLKVYDATDKTDIVGHQLANFKDIQAYDVIPVEGFLFMIGGDGFYLYDYTDIKNIKLAGRIPVVKN